MKKQIVSAVMATLLTATISMPLTVNADEWVKTDSGYKYEYDDGTTAPKGWLTVDGKKYYIQKDETRKTGWLKTSSGAKYYFDKNGVMKKSSWLTMKSGDKYYLRKNGKAAVNCTLTIDGKSCTFDKDGLLIEQLTTIKKDTSSPKTDNSSKKVTTTTKKKETTATTTTKPYTYTTHQTTSKSNTVTVYITKTGKKYHYSDTCNGGTYIPSTLSEATSRGLTPCNKCVN